MVGDGQIRQELCDFVSPHVLGMALVMNQDKAFDPLHIGLFRAEAIVPGANGLPTWSRS